MHSVYKFIGSRLSAYNFSDLSWVWISKNKSLFFYNLVIFDDVLTPSYEGFGSLCIDKQCTTLYVVCFCKHAPYLLLIYIVFCRYFTFDGLNTKCKNTFFCGVFLCQIEAFWSASDGSIKSRLQSTHNDHSLVWVFFFFFFFLLKRQNSECNVRNFRRYLFGWVLMNWDSKSAFYKWL